MGKKGKKQQQGVARTAEQTPGRKTLPLWFGIVAAGFFVAAVTLVIYFPALANNFVNLDDPEYVSERTEIRSVNLEFVRWMFGFHFSNWHPLTWFSHALDYAIWGLNPWGHHLSNVAFHSMNVFLLSVLAYMIVNYRGQGVEKRALITAAVTALVFGIHPVHVESVAWVSERKDVLSTFFVLLTLISYVRYVVAREEPGRSGALLYGMSLIFFILALMSKPMAVTVPVMLVLLDIYPFGRFEGRFGTPLRLKVLMEKVPFFVLSLMTGVLTIIAQYRGGAMKPFEHFPLFERCVIAVRGISFYLEKMVFPAGLSPYYPYPTEGISFANPPYFIRGGAVVLATLLSIWAWRRGKRVFAMTWAYYIVTLLPVLGIIQVGGQAAADRYTYIPSIGPFFLFGLGIATGLEWLQGKGYSSTRNKTIILLPLVAVLGLLGAMTVKQTGTWKDFLSLWDSVIERFPNHADAYLNRAKIYSKMGKYEEALRDLDRTSQLDHKKKEAFFQRGYVHAVLGKHSEAIMDFDRAIELDPKYAEAYNNRGLSSLDMGDYPSALKNFSRVTELDPTYAVAYNNSADAYVRLKDYHKALENLNKAIELEPAKYHGFYVNRCELQNLLTQYPQAVNDCSKALDLNPRDARGWRNRGIAYLKLGRNSEATADFRKAAGLGDREVQRILRERGITWQ